MNKKWPFNHHGGHQPLLLVLGQALLHVLAQLLVVVVLLLQLADLRLVEGLAGRNQREICQKVEENVFSASNSSVSDGFSCRCLSGLGGNRKKKIWYFADENYREILLSLQLVPELLQLDTHIVIVPGTAPTICQSLLLLANDHRGAAKAPLSQIPSDYSDRNFVFCFFFGSLKRICSNLRSSWFWLSMPSLKSSRWLISCLSAFSDERITDTCWFCIFSSLWLRLRLWISCSRRELRLATCAAERDDNVRGRRYEPPVNKWEEKSK